MSTPITTTVSSVSQALERVGAHRIVPVVVVPAPGLADGLGDALAQGGLPIAEVTLRTPYALDAIGELARRGDLLVGAGTVVRPEQVDVVADSGAAFVVSPGLDARIVERCWERGLAVLPGVATATELQAASSLGVETVKFFPAEQAGGAAMVKALSGPFPDASFVPTGGISAANAADYLALPCVKAVGGSWMVPADALAAGDWERVVALVSATREVAAGVSR